MKPVLVRHSARYIGVAGCCAVINNGLLIALDATGLQAIGCVAVSVTVMIPLAYALHTRWTFNTVAEKAGFARYAAISLLNLPASMVLILLLRDMAGLPMIVVAPTVTIVLSCLNFLTAHWSIARQRSRLHLPFQRGRS
jgi:putative flippase GtrA